MKQIFDLYHGCQSRWKTKYEGRKVRNRHAAYNLPRLAMLTLQLQMDVRHIPVSEGISPEKAADVNGPTVVIKSCAKIYLATSGTLSKPEVNS